MPDFDVQRWGTNIQNRDYPLEIAPAPKESKLKSYVKDQFLKLPDLKLPVGLPVKLNEAAIIAKQESYQAFKEMKNAPPPQDLKFSIKTDLQTFNHVNDYVIHDDMIWYRRRNQTEEPWIAMYPDGYPTVKPVKVQADGTNLIVIDDAGYIHYKKILKETLRIFEIEAQEFGPPDRKAMILAQNETHVYTIKDNIIWVRASDQKSAQWQPLYFEGWPDRFPETLLVDGSTLTIYDNDNQKYVVDVSQGSLENKLKGQSFPYRYHYAYFAVAKDAKDNWKDRWFTLPMLSEVLDFYKQKKLKLPDNVIDFAVSNRGGFSACWEDFAGSEHPSCPGSELPGSQKKNFSQVTGCYAVVKGESFIRFADPWLPGGFDLKSLPGVPNKKIDLPTDFECEKISASASMLFISGKNSLGERRLCCTLADFDTTFRGKRPMNPFLTYGDLKHNKNTEKHPIEPNVRILPANYKELTADDLWTSISLDGLGDNADYKNITILQTGPGNNAKELRIASLDENEQGYYWKSMQEDVPWAWRQS